MRQKKISIIVPATNAWKASKEVERILTGEAVRSIRVLSPVKLLGSYSVAPGYLGWVVEIRLPTLERYVGS